MVYDYLSVLLNSVCQYFVEDFRINVNWSVDLEFSFFVVSLSVFGIRVTLAL